MSDLDEKLKEIYSEVWALVMDGQDEEDYSGEVTTKIKQAFKDAGWTPVMTIEADEVDYQPSQERFGERTDTNQTFTLAKDRVMPELPELMTGQEWYDRFFAEISHTIGWGYGPGEITRKQIVAVAKKAAGIE